MNSSGEQDIDKLLMEGDVDYNFDLQQGKNAIELTLQDYLLILNFPFCNMNMKLSSV